MRVCFLGTGGYHPNERRHTACVLLPETGVVFDAGTAFFRAAERLLTDEVQIFLSHAHLDHIAGLTFFLAPLLTGRVKRARLYGNAATLAAVRKHLFSSAIFPLLPSYQFIVLEPGDSVELPDSGKLRHQPLTSHPGGSTAFRIDWPAGKKNAARSLAYVTDTTVDGSYTDFIRGVDVLIHECYFRDEHADWAARTGHSCTSAVGRVARDAQVGRLAIVHVDPQRPDDDPIDLEKCRALHADAFLAEDLLEWECW